MADTGPQGVTFDVVIATRNRVEALRLSLPLILAQSRLPEKLIIIDSSDDPAVVAQAVAEATRGAAIPVILEHGPKGISYQRNRGLALASADVVFFPDDDSLCHPGTTAAMMAVYDRDTGGRIAGVVAADAPEPPPGALAAAAYDLSAAHKREARVVTLRYRLERAFTDLNPFKFLGTALQKSPTVPDFLAGMDCAVVEYLTGYRMSFRTEYIRAARFEENFSGYSLYEDAEASFGVARFGILIGAREGRIYHHRYPGGRPDRFAFAAMAVLNRAYVIAKHATPDRLSPADIRAVRRKMRNYALIRMAALVVKATSPGARQDLRGTWVGYRAMAAVLTAPPQALTGVYTAAKARLGLG